MKNKILFLLVVLLAANSLFSQDATLSPETQKIKIRAKREINDPLNTSLATTIITSDELKAKGAKNLADALKNNTGIQVIDQGGSSILNIRGSRPEQTVILINGVELNKAQGLGVDLNAYTVENIERIEIIRGAAATRYGANAIGGVINIITKDRVDGNDGIESYIRYGSFNTIGISALASKSFGKENQGSLFISGVVNTSKGNFPYNFDKNGTTWTGKMDNNKNLNGSVRAGMSYKLNEKDVINFDLSALQEEKEIPASHAFGFSGSFGEAYQEVQNYGGSLSYENNSASVFNFGIKANVLAQVKTYDDPTYSTHDKYNNISSGISATLDRVDRFGGDIFTLKTAALISYKNDFFYTENPRPEVLTGNPNAVARNTISIAYLPELGFLNFENTEISRLTIFPAIRFDAILGNGAIDNKDYYEPSYSLGAMYTIDRDRRYNIKANFNTGYRVPGFDDLYAPDTGYTKGNTDLKKEQSVGGDIGFIITPHDIIRLEALYYISEVDNMITWVSDPTTFVFAPLNVDKALLQGVEASLVLSVPIKPALSRVELSLNYLNQFGKAVGGVNDGKMFARTPKYSADGILSYIYEGDEKVSGRLNFLTHYIGKRYNDLANTQEIAETLLFDLTASLTILDTITIEGGVKNLADKRYENIIGYLQAGREWYAGVRARF